MDSTQSLLEKAERLKNNIPELHHDGPLDEIELDFESVKEIYWFIGRANVALASCDPTDQNGLRLLRLIQDLSLLT